MSNRPILVLGESGQVARELARLAPALGRPLVFRGRREFDLTSGRSLTTLLDELSPAAVINAAAYTAVDLAESEPQAAFLLNRDAPADLAAACAARAIPLVHFSTDFVFDGAKTKPYVEDDARNPVNVYGRSKAAGEDAVAAAGGPHAILRTSWVYSSMGHNFVRTMLRLAEEREEVRVVADQWGRPTWAKECASAALLCTEAMMDGESFGVMHLAGEGDAVWADFAEAVFEDLARRNGRRPRLVRIAGAEYPTPARRPANSRLDCSLIGARLGWRARPWQESLGLCMDEIARGE